MRTAPKISPPQASTSSTRDHILDTAEKLFAERGFAGTAMRDIASSIGLNAASLYNHFPGKRALYEAVLERGLRPLFELMDQLAESDWTPERLDKLTDALLTHLAQRPQVPRLLMHEALEGGTRLPVLAQDWLRPLYARALGAFRQSQALRDWEEEEVPLLLMALYHLVLGYFAATPMLREVLGEDPLSKPMVERQRGFTRKAVRRLLTRDAPPGKTRPGRRSGKPRRKSTQGDPT
jgi:AcrR family transcriptional regulator